ncbi:Phenylalanine--tRNA ligase beta subunit [Folsomia candida]|uniref:Phenylalanine--tRNA ligase beta subunit n=1 Tax=Folsomia candida TaxID=158441 RepID=A0A226EBE7_FOLCA|nr:Phenylalanine--tRNA ligase beta subunit [Folsomia candida]OXA54977.1 Phenylalanine--tRNA ligase beta subunit [Folsomia candida]
MSDSLKFSILQIDVKGTKLVEIVPLSWIDETEKVVCWPPAAKLKSLSKKGSSLPLPSWRQQNFEKILGKYASWEIACEKLKVAEETSNIESDSEEEPPHRRRNNVPQALIEGNPPKISSDSSGEEEEGDIAVVPPSVTLDSEATPPNHPPDSEVQLVNEEGGAILLTSFQEIQDLKKLILGFQKQCFEILERQNIDIKDIKSVLHNLKATNGDGPTADFSVIPTHPLNNKEELDILENWIRDAKANRDTLIDYLALTGGKTPQKNVRKLYKKFFVFSFARQINWTGKGGKISLKPLEFLGVVKEAVRRKHNTATDDDIESVSKDYFRFLKE